MFLLAEFVSKVSTTVPTSSDNNMTHDFIEHSKRIEAALKQAGCLEIAERFEEARLGSSTSGEILMRLRHEGKTNLGDDAIPQAVKDDMTALAKAIDASGV